jgi:3-phenylpropionate/cinnamic acid dioxygenase small subunit
MTDTQEPLVCQVQCSRLCADFAHFVDSRDYEKLAALFVDSGIFERRGEVLQGREAILRAMRARPENVVTRHICTNIRIDLQIDGTANGTCILLLFVGQPNEKPSTTIAEYHDTYVATAEGWRIKKRVANIVFGA